MSLPFAAAESSLNAGNFLEAEKELRKVRPGLHSSLEALKLWTRLHSAECRWTNVDVICRVIRTDFPAETYGFAQGAESLHQQGRSAEAIALLKQCETGLAEEPAVSYALARYHCALDNLLGATVLLGTAFSQDITLREKAFADGDLRKVWADLKEPVALPASS